MKELEKMGSFKHFLKRKGMVIIMNSLNLAFMSLGKKMLTLILIVLELTALFTAEIYMVNVIRERSMLNAPYGELLNQNCFFVYDRNFPQKKMEDPSLTFLGSQNELLKGLKGDYQIYNILSASIDSYYIVSVNDDIYRALALPLSSGNYGKDKNSAVAAKTVSKGKRIIHTSDGSFELNICGSLTENTFIPGTKLYSVDITTSDLYMPISEKNNIIITNRSAIQGFEDQFVCDLGFLIVFSSEIEENVAFLRSNAEVLNGTRLADNTKKALNDDFKNFIPLLCCLILIVIIGVVCVSLTIFNENRYRNGVLWLCGYSKAKILLIHAESIVILPVISLAVSAILLLFIRLINLELAAGIRFTLPCFAAALITCVFLLTASMAVPIIKTAGRSPVEYLGRAK